MADTSLAFVVRFRFVAALWCIVESLLFGGLFFGWASLVYVFKQEGIYHFLCNHPAANGSIGSNVSNSLEHMSIRNREPHTLYSGNKSLAYPSYNIQDTEDGVDVSDGDRRPPASCKEQDAVLNLWFTIAVSVLSIATSVIGWILYRFGPLVLRFIGSVTFCMGTLMLAFVDNNAPWIICPGLLSMAFGAVCINAANLQVIPFLFDRGSSVAVSLLTGFYYSASTTQWLIKVAFENGIPRQHSYILLTALNVVFVTANSILFFRVSPHPVQELTVPVKENDVTANESQQFRPLVAGEKPPAVMDGKEQVEELNLANGSPPTSPRHDMDSPMLPSAVVEEVTPTLRSCVFNRTFMFHLFWFVVNDFYLLTFIGISNAMLERVLQRDTGKVNHFTDVFSFSLMCAAIFAVVGGFLYDCQRMAFKEHKGYHRQLLPAVFPITMTTLLGAVTVGLQFIQAEEILYALFVLFVIYKQCVFALTWSFIVDVYPRKYFGVFYGIVFTTAGIVLFLQYAIFTWIASGPFAPISVNLFLLCLLLLSLVNPLNLLIKGTCGQRQPQRN